MISWLTSALNLAVKPLGTVVYIGAGSGNKLTELCEMTPKSVVAAEASEALFASLQRKARKLKNVEAIKGWVLPSGVEKQSACLFNNPRYNSLCKPHKLTDKLPNIKLVREQQIKGIGIDKLLKEITFSDSSYNIMVLTVQGAEQALLEGISYDLIQPFDFIMLQPPEYEYYVTAPTLEIENFDKILGFSATDSFSLYRHNYQAAKLNKVLAQKMVECDSLSSEVDQLKDESKQQLQITHDLKLQQEQSLARLKSVSDELENVLEQNTSLRTQVESLKEQRDKQEGYHLKNKAWAEQLRESNNTLNTRLASAEEALLATQKQFKASEEQLVLKAEEYAGSLSEIKQLRDEIEQLNRTLEKVTEERESQKAHHLKNKEWAEGLNEANRKKQLEINELESQVAALESSNKSLTNSLSEIEKREKQIITTLEVNGKLMTKLEADKAHLLQQYREKAQSENEMKKLITELHLKLQQAAAFYHKLEQQHPELLIEADEQ